MKSSLALHYKFSPNCISRRECETQITQLMWLQEDFYQSLLIDVPYPTQCSLKCKTLYKSLPLQYFCTI